MASDAVEHPVRWHGGGRNSWEPRSDMDSAGAQANANCHELLYRFVHSLIPF